jgi:hypothetical protein
MKRKENAMSTGTVTSHGTPLNKRSGPGTNYPVVGSVPDGTTVTIVCQATGTTETGDWGATDLWDCLDDNTYVSDAFVYTGTNGMVAPACNGSQPPATDQVTAWIEQALQVMNMPADPDTIQDLQIIIMHESSGDPNAVNLTDSNAQAGTPSKGLMQCIQPTFDQYHKEPYDNIFGPVDSIIAGTRYAIATYGSLDLVPGVIAVKAGQPYVGY